MKPHFEIILFSLIMIVALFFRFHQLDMIPPGLYPDEAMNGNNAIQALESGFSAKGGPASGWKVFYPENNGREGLFINLQAISIYLFGNTSWALRAVSALVGTLTVAGLYLLTRKLLNWQMAAVASLLMAVSFWHVNFSRIGFRAIMAPLFLVWGIYFFWQGLTSGRYKFFILSGLAWGLGFHTYIAFRIMPLALAVAFFGYMYGIRKDFSHFKYAFTRRRIIMGLAVFCVVFLLVILPLVKYFAQNPQDFVGRTGETSLLKADHPWKQFFIGLWQTLAMFNFAGDHNWRHNIAGEPVLYLPVGVLFVVGFLRSVMRLLNIWKRHGHFSPVHLLLLSWFFIGLAPTILSREGLPHSLRTIIVAPVVFIFAAKGMWWLYEVLERWYMEQHPHQFNASLPHHRHFFVYESVGISALAGIIFLIAIASAEYNRYFNVWAKNPEVFAEFTQSYVNIANQLNRQVSGIPQYILANRGDVFVNGISVHAQTVMYLTDTSTSEKQKAKNIFYLNEKDYYAGYYPKDAVIIPLIPFK